MSFPTVLLLAGPTASGKSDLALDLARRVRGEIINADSMQVYEGLPLLSAMPSLADQAQVPHHLYGTQAPDAEWSVGAWLRAALALIADIRERGCVPIVTGGTGLYFTALTKGLAEIPPVPMALREIVGRELEEEGEDEFRARLRRIDPQAEARITSGDRQRLVRAMAVHRASGRALSDWQAQTHPALGPDEWRGIVLDPPRDWLHRRCDLRFEQMLHAGALEEVEALGARAIPAGAGVYRTLGYRELLDHLSGVTDLATAQGLAQAATRQFAKRQCTWFRNQMQGWERIEAVDPDVRLTAILG